MSIDITDVLLDKLLSVVPSGEKTVALVATPPGIKEAFTTTFNCTLLFEGRFAIAPDIVFPLKVLV